MEISDLNEKMKKTINVLKEDLNGIQANKVSDTILKNIIVQFEDGRKQSIISMSVIRIVNNKTLAVKPYNKEDLNILEKTLAFAKLNASIGRQEHEVIITFPDLTTQRREELKKLINEFALKAKNSIRDLRNAYLKANKTNSKEENIKIEKDIQKHIDNANNEVDKIKESKQNDLNKI